MNTLDPYIYLIVALMPVTACLVVFQVNPYHTLAMRGILGAIAALIYTMLGAPDVALTEALVGTLLAITLYAIAVRSSLVLRLGVLENGLNLPQGDTDFLELLANFRKIFKRRQMRIEMIDYADLQALERGLMEKEVHAICVPSWLQEPSEKPYHTSIRVQRIYDILKAELSSTKTGLSYVNVPEVTSPKFEEKES